MAAPSGASASTAASPGAPSAPASGPAAALGAPLARENAQGAGCPDPEAAFRRARRASGEGRWQDAIVAFDLAIRARPVQARLRAERGYAYLKSGDAKRARQDFYDALTLTKERRLSAECWYNVALAEAALGDEEATRLAYVLAERHGSKAATVKLGTASRCVATWRVNPPGDVPIARGWEELAAARFLVNCELPSLDPAAHPSARTRACRGCGYGNSDEEDQCTGEAPWAVASGYMHFHFHTFFVVPLPGDAFFYQNTSDAPGPPKVRVDGDWLVVSDGYAEGGVGRFFAGGSDLLYGRFRGEDAFVRSGGGWSDQMENDGTWSPDSGTGCQPDLAGEVELPEAVAAQMCGTPMIPEHPGPALTTWISISQRRAVFELSAYAAGVTVKLRGGTAEIRGGGCTADVPIEPGNP